MSGRDRMSFICKARKGFWNWRKLHCGLAGPRKKSIVFFYIRKEFWLSLVDSSLDFDCFSIGLFAFQNYCSCFWCLPTSSISLTLSGFVVSSSSRYMVTYAIHNGNRAEWSPIRSVIIRVTNKIEQPLY